MSKQNLQTSNSVIGFMFGCLIFGFLAIGIASAASAASDEAQSADIIESGWTIEKLGDQNVLRFNEELKTENGHDLKVSLSPNTEDLHNEQ